jgi:hypothetical protein
MTAPIELSRSSGLIVGLALAALVVGLVLMQRRSRDQ